MNNPGQNEIQQVWECPECGCQMGVLPNAEGIIKLGADERGPTCQLGHPAAEMEQKLPAAWRESA